LRIREVAERIKGMTKLEEHYDELGMAIKRMAASFVPNSNEYDDLVAVGWMGVWRAELVFNEALNVPFTAFARFKAFHEMQSHLRGIDWLSRPYRTLVRNGVSPKPVLISMQIAMRVCGRDSIERLECGIDAETLLRRSNLTRQQRRVVDGYTVGDKKFWEIAEEIGVNESRACKLWHMSVQKMQNLVGVRSGRIAA
jgi:RNA polymerase sigma factor (sigma-70 family)